MKCLSLGRVGFAFLSTLSAVLPSTSAHAFDVPQHHLPGELLVKFEGIDPQVVMRAPHDGRAFDVVEQATAKVTSVTGVELRFVSPIGRGWARYSVDATTEAATEALLRIVSDQQKQAGITAIQVNHWKRPLRTPNDTFFDYQWMIDSINGTQAWDISTGNAATRVGVIDTGTLTDHEDLVGKDAAGFDFISFAEVSNDGNGQDADYFDEGDDDQSYHGSHVAGTILANSNNSTGIAGLDWEARLVTGRALGSGGGLESDIVEAMFWMAGETVNNAPALSQSNRPKVVNMSLGADTSCSSLEQEAVDASVSAGVIIVAASGNSGAPVGSPANCVGAIAVAALTRDNTLAGYSNFGSSIDVVAPGGDQSSAFEDGVLSLYANIGQDPPYTFYQGTSMASPHVAGVVSLMLDVNPNLTVNQIISIFADTGAASCSGCQGKPVLDAAAALVAAGGDLPEAACNIDNGSGCSNDTQCFVLTAGQPECIDTGGLGEGDDCTNDPFGCQTGTVCLNGPGGEQCYRRCDMNFSCGSGQDCIDGGTFSYCDPIDPNSTVVVPGPGEPAEREPNGSCNPDRGNLDCPTDYGCSFDSNLDGHFCFYGDDGETGIGGLCEDDEDCSTGLCQKGVCTTECDDDGGCRDGFDCDTRALPGNGLCVPENCGNEDETFCESGWACQYSPTNHYVCGVGESNYRGVLCSHSGGQRGSGVVGLLALLLTGFAVGRRRR